MIKIPYDNWDDVCHAYDKYCKHKHDVTKGSPVFIMWLEQTFKPEEDDDLNQIIPTPIEKRFVPDTGKCYVGKYHYAKSTNSPCDKPHDFKLKK